MPAHRWQAHAVHHCVAIAMSGRPTTDLIGATSKGAGGDHHGGAPSGVRSVTRQPSSTAARAHASTTRTPPDGTASEPL
jgi:hypothetical protein